MSERPQSPDQVHDRSQLDPSDKEPAEGAPEAKDEKKGGPGTVGWWLDDGPDSPIAADIEEPEKHL